MALGVNDSLIAIWLTWGAAFIFVSLRVVYRISHQQRRLEFGDWLLIVGITVEMANRIAGSIVAYQAAAVPKTDPPTPEYIRIRTSVLKFDYAQGFVYILAINCIKASFITGYYKLTPSLPRNFRRALWLIVLQALIAGILPTLAIRFSWCRPLSLNWTISPTGTAVCQAMYLKGHVINYTVQHIITDLGIMVFGLALLSYLPSSPTRSEVPAIIFIVFLGMVSIGASIGRFVLAYYGNYDDQGLWCSVEISSGVVAACLPSFRAWYRGVVGRTPQRVWGSEGSGGMGESEDVGAMRESIVDVFRKRSCELEEEGEGVVTEGGLGWRNR